MSTMSAVSRAPQSNARVWFEKHLPELRSRCRAFVCRLPRGDGEEAEAEVLAQSFRYVLGAEARGKLDRLTPYTLVGFFGRSYYAGQRITGTRTTDVLSEAGRRKHGRRVISLNDPSARDPAYRSATVPLAEVLADPKADRPPENARRNIDYPRILAGEEVPPKVRRVFAFLCETAGSGRQTELARELGVSPARVCQLKGELAGMLAAHGYRPPTACRADSSRKKRGRPPGRILKRPSKIPLNVGTSPARRA